MQVSPTDKPDQPTHHYISEPPPSESVPLVKLEKDKSVDIHAINACPLGGEHQFSKDFTCCGIAWAVCCFPLGLICLFSDRETKCIKCDYTLYHNSN